MTEETGGGGRPDARRRLAKGGPEDDPSRRALLAGGGELSDQDLEAVVGGLTDRELQMQQRQHATWAGYGFN